MRIIELLTPAYDVAWLPWAVQYFFLIGIAATTAVTAAVLVLAGHHKGHRPALLTAVIALLAVTAIAAPVSLLADLHQPARFWHFYAYPAPWSWMSLGAFLLPVFVGLSCLFCLLWWLGRTAAMKVLSVLLIASAVSVLVYTGMEVMVVRSRPLWHTPFLPVNFALTGWLAALGALWVMARWLPAGLAGMPVVLLKRLSQASVLLLMVCAMAWVVRGLTGSEPSFTAAIQLFEDFPVWRLGLFGSVLTGLLIGALVMLPARLLSGYWASLMLGIIMMAAAWMFRWIIFMAVQGVPKYGAGLYLYTMPLGADGLAGMLGMLGLCVALICGVTLLLQRFPSPLTTAAAAVGRR